MTPLEYDVYIADCGNIVINHNNPTWNGIPVPKDIWQRGLKMQIKGLYLSRYDYVDQWMYARELGLIRQAGT